MTGNQRTDPFLALGLNSDAELSDADVLVAWRRIAAATHPDRADGGDPDRFAVAAAAYTDLRTRSGRGEARAGLRQSVPRSGTPGTLGRLVRGWPFRLALRFAVAAAAATAGILAAGPDPAGPALAVGALTWLVIGARRNIPPTPRKMIKDLPYFYQQ